MTAISKRTFLKFAAAGAAAVPASPLLAADAKAEPKLTGTPRPMSS